MIWIVKYFLKKFVIIVINYRSSAVVSTSVEQKPVRLPRRSRPTASRRCRSAADVKSHRALAAYVNLAIITYF